MMVLIYEVSIQVWSEDGGEDGRNDEYIYR
jgi:hypothetical protein